MWPETCFGVKTAVSVNYCETVKRSSRSLFRRRFWLLGGRCRQKSLGMVNACVRDRDAVVRVPFAVSKHYLCLFALLCLLLFDQELRPMAVFLWRSIAYDQHGLSARPILSEFVHDVITQKHICRLRMIFYIWRQERERTLPKDQIHVYEVNGSGKPGPWVHNCIFFRFLSCR